MGALSEGVCRQVTLRHIGIYAKEKPYQCEYCKKYFTRSDLLKQRTHTSSVCISDFMQSTFFALKDF